MWNVKEVNRNIHEKYKFKGTDEIYSGTALMSGGILIPCTSGDDAAFELFFEKQ